MDRKQMMEKAKDLMHVKSVAGFSLVELIMSMAVTLIILGAGIAAFTSSLNMRSYETSRTDALASTQAAINIMSREIGNSGFGLAHDDFETNGLVFGDCSGTRIHFRNNTNNSNLTTSDPGEDLTFYYDADTQSVVRYDAATNTRSGVINQVSQVSFTYWNYESEGGSGLDGDPTEQTARITIRLTVLIAGDGDAGNPRNVTVESDITLRNSQYGLGRY